MYFLFTVNKTKSIERSLCTQQCYFFCNQLWYDASNKFYLYLEDKCSLFDERFIK